MSLIELNKVNAGFAFYEKHLASYARREYLPLELGRNIERALMVAVNNLRIDEEYGEDVALGAGIVMGDISLRVDGRWGAIKTAFGSPESTRAYFKSCTQVKIRYVSAWLKGEFSGKPIRTVEEYVGLLTQVERGWPSFLLK